MVNLFLIAIDINIKKQQKMHVFDFKIRTYITVYN